MTDHGLVRLYWPEELRPAFDALMAIDAAMADVVTSSTEPALGAIRLAWWREALERLDSAPPPPEPRLQAAADLALSRGVTGSDLAKIEAGYAALMQEEVDWSDISKGGIALARVAAALLGSNDPRLEDAGILVFHGRLRRLGLTAASWDRFERLRGHRFGKRVRPFTALARLAARDLRNADTLESEATPGRAVALLSHRMFGTVA